MHRLFVDPESDAERTILQEGEQRIVRSRAPGKKMHRLGQDGFADEERGFECFDPLGDPAVVLFPSVEKGNERPGISDRQHRGQSPRDIQGS